MPPDPAQSEPRGRSKSAALRQYVPLVLACIVAAGLFAGLLNGRGPGQRSLSPEARQLIAIGVAPVTPPRPVPPLAFSDAQGHSLNVTNLTGRAILLNFWATWCAPCRQEMPSLDRLQATLGGPDFQVIAISIDRQGAAAVLPFYRELKLRSLGIDLDPSGTALAALDAPGIPVTLLIDSNGREIGRALGALEWDSPKVIDVLRKSFGLGTGTTNVRGLRKEASVTSETSR